MDAQPIALMTGSAPRISVHLQRATTSQATQTEPLWPKHSWEVAHTGSHTFPKMKHRAHRKMSKTKGFACWENQDNRQHQAGSFQCSVDSQENPSLSGEDVQKTVTHRERVME